MKLKQKLLEIQKSVDDFTKDTKGYNFKYVSGDQVLSVIRPKMNELGLLCTPLMKDIKIELIQKQKKDKIDFQYLFQANGGFKWCDTDSDEELLIDWVFTGENDDPSQAQGNALTYNQRYFLLKFFNIPTDGDDPDAKKTTNQGNYNKKSDYKKPTKDQTTKPSGNDSKEMITTNQKKWVLKQDGYTQENVDKLTRAEAKVI